ncbi:hypothetical protein LTS08_000028 [Lithohypha guttulata]|nr:hypothetical protein LTS08_000028 [Lithohypha guttulata]
MIITTVRCFLITLTFLGGYLIHGFSSRNGFYGAVTRLTEQRIVHDGTPYTNTFTGIAALDGTLSTLLTFFWPVVDGNNPGLSLACFLFAGQFVAAWTVTIIEGLRTGKTWRLASFTTIYGLLVQTTGAALMTPAWTALHLFATPTVSRPSIDTLSVPESSLRALPYSITLGFIAPSIAMSLPTPGLISQQNRIYAICIWQAFPLWNTVFPGKSNTTSTKNQHAQQLRLLRHCYIFALSIASTVQIATLTLSFSALLFPGLFTLITAQQLHPRNLFIPPNPFRSSKISGISQGAFWFIQFDCWTTSIAYFIWGLALRYAGKESRGYGGSLMDVVVRPLGLGFMGAGLSFVWERDEMVFAGGNEGGKRRVKVL